MAVSFDKKSLAMEAALKMVQAACEKAEELGILINVAVVDDGANLKAFARMDRAPLLSSEIAQNKAYTAAAFGLPTSDWYPMIEKEPALLHGIVHTDRLVVFGGGLPIFVDDQLVGGIGVSGGTAEEDVICAEAALKRLQQA